MSSASNVSVKHDISFISLQPSLSSSVSVSSGIPSSSVSNSDDIIVRSKDPEYAELFAQMVYVLALKVVVAIPDITPVEALNSIARGKEGYISQLIMSPPDVTGTRGVIL